MKTENSTDLCCWKLPTGSPGEELLERAELLGQRLALSLLLLQRALHPLHLAVPLLALLPSHHFLFGLGKPAADGGDQHGGGGGS